MPALVNKRVSATLLVFDLVTIALVITLLLISYIRVVRGDGLVDPERLFGQEYQTIMDPRKQSGLLFWMLITFGVLAVVTIITDIVQIANYEDVGRDYDIASLIFQLAVMVFFLVMLVIRNPNLIPQWLVLVVLLLSTLVVGMRIINLTRYC